MTKLKQKKDTQAKIEKYMYMAKLITRISEK